MIDEGDHGKIVKSAFIFTRLVGHDMASDAHAFGGDRQAANEQPCSARDEQGGDDCEVQPYSGA